MLNVCERLPAAIETNLSDVGYFVNSLVTDPGKVLKAADKYLYKAKQWGRNRVEYQLRQKTNNKKRVTNNN